MDESPITAQISSYPVRPLSELTTDEMLNYIESRSSDLSGLTEHEATLYFYIKAKADQLIANERLTGIYHPSLNLTDPKKQPTTLVELTDYYYEIPEADWLRFRDAAMNLYSYFETIHGDDGIEVTVDHPYSLTIRIHGDECMAVLERSIFYLLETTATPFFIEFKLPFIRVSPILLTDDTFETKFVVQIPPLT